MRSYMYGFLLILLLSVEIHSQPLPDWTTQFPISTTYGRSSIPLTQIQGSPYLDNIFRKGTIVTIDSVVYKDIPLRYNCYLDILEFQKEEGAYNIMPKNKVKRAEFGWQKYKFLENKSMKGYFGILVEGRATLLVRYTIRFYEPGPAQGFQEASPACFDDLHEVFYISLNNSPAVKIRNHKVLLEVLNDKKEQIKTYISSLKLTTERPEDMKKIVNFYNNLR